MFSTKKLPILSAKLRQEKQALVNALLNPESIALVRSMPHLLQLGKPDKPEQLELFFNFLIRHKGKQTKNITDCDSGISRDRQHDAGTLFLLILDATESIKCIANHNEMELKALTSLALDFGAVNCFLALVNHPKPLSAIAATKLLCVLCKAIDEACTVTPEQLTDAVVNNFKLAYRQYIADNIDQYTSLVSFLFDKGANPERSRAEDWHYGIGCNPETGHPMNIIEFCTRLDDRTDEPEIRSLLQKIRGETLSPRYD